jgi:hypothetical protein
MYRPLVTTSPAISRENVDSRSPIDEPMNTSELESNSISEMAAMESPNGPCSSGFLGRLLYVSSAHTYSEYSVTFIV